MQIVYFVISQFYLDHVSPIVFDVFRAAYYGILVIMSHYIIEYKIIDDVSTLAHVPDHCSCPDLRATLHDRQL